MPSRPVPTPEISPRFDRRWMVVVGLFALAIVPMLTGALHRAQQPWAPESDEATIAVRSRDVLTGNAPSVGMMSAGNEGLDDPRLHHPGPVQFYYLAPFSVGSSPVGPQLVAAVGAMVLAAAAMVAGLAGLGGPRLAAAGTVALALILWGLGTDPVGSVWNPYFVILPYAAFLALAILTCARGPRWLLLTLALASVVVQGHLAYIGLVGLTAGWAFGVALVREGRQRGVRTAARLAAAGVAVLVLLWAPPLYQELTGEPGNLSQIVRLALQGDGETVGADGLGELARVVGLPGVGLQPSDDHVRVLPPLDGGRALVASLPFLAAAGLALAAHRRGDRTALLAVLTVGVILTGAAFTAMRLPRTDGLVYQYYALWLWPTAAIGWLVLAWAAARVAGVGPWLRSRLPGPSGPLGAIVATAMAVLVVAIGLLSRPGAWEPWVANRIVARSVVPSGVEALLDRDPGSGDGELATVLVRMSGPTPFLSTASALMAELEYRGIEVVMDPNLELAGWPWGEHRRHRAQAIDAEIWVVSGTPAGVPDGAELLASAPVLGPRHLELLTEIEDDLGQILARDGFRPGPDPPATDQDRALVDAAGADPHAALADGTLAALVARGMASAPGGDLHALHTHQRLAMMAAEGDLRVYLVDQQRS